MPTTLQKLLLKIAPFIAIGIFLVLFVIGLVVFSYLLILGAAVGLILFLIAWIRNKFCAKGRIIDHERKP